MQVINSHANLAIYYFFFLLPLTTRIIGWDVYTEAMLICIKNKAIIVY